MSTRRRTPYMLSTVFERSVALWGVALLFMGWSFLAAVGWFPNGSLPGPVAVARALAAELYSGRLLQDVVASLFRVSAGFMLALGTGVPTGLLIGHSSRARRALLPLVNFFRSLSPLAWVPFATLWFGIGDVPSIFLIFISAVFPIVLSTSIAIANIPPVYFRVAAELGMSRSSVLKHVTLPGIAPQLITTVRVSVGVAWLVVVAAEMIAGRDGLGFAVWDARSGLRPDLVAAAMVTIGAIGVVLDRLLRRLTTVPSVRWAYLR